MAVWGVAGDAITALSAAFSKRTPLEDIVQHNEIPVAAAAETTADGMQSLVEDLFHSLTSAERAYTSKQLPSPSPSPRGPTSTSLVTVDQQLAEVKRQYRQAQRATAARSVLVAQLEQEVATLTAANQQLLHLSSSSSMLERPNSTPATAALLLPGPAVEQATQTDGPAAGPSLPSAEAQQVTRLRAELAAAQQECQEARVRHAPCAASRAQMQHHHLEQQAKRFALQEQQLARNSAGLSAQVEQLKTAAAAAAAARKDRLDDRAVAALGAQRTQLAEAQQQLAAAERHVEELQHEAAAAHQARAAAERASTEAERASALLQEQLMASERARTAVQEQADRLAARSGEQLAELKGMVNQLLQHRDELQEQAAGLQAELELARSRGSISTNSQAHPRCQFCLEFEARKRVHPDWTQPVFSPARIPTLRAPGLLQPSPMRRF